MGKKSSVAWLAKSISGCGHTPKSTVTPTHSAMARALSAGTGTASGVGDSVSGSSSSSRICSLSVVTATDVAAGVAHSSPPFVSPPSVLPPAMPPSTLGSAEPTTPPSRSPSPPARMSTATRR